MSKRTADRVARHLVYAGMMMDENPELAYEHAKAAYRQAARVDVVREALGIAAYLTGRYSEALRELRTYRRMTDDYSHAPLEADAERGLGKPEKALSFIAEVPLKRLSPAAQIELAIVTSGARADTGDYAGGLSVIERIKSENLGEELRARVELVKADRLAEVGQTEEAEELRRRWTPVYEGEGEVDLLMEIEEEPEEDQTAEEAATEDLAAGAGDEEAAQDEAAAAEAAGAEAAGAEAAGDEIPEDTAPEATTEKEAPAQAEESQDDTVSVEGTETAEAETVAPAQLPVESESVAEEEARAPEETPAAEEETPGGEETVSQPTVSESDAAAESNSKTHVEAAAETAPVAYSQPEPETDNAAEPEEAQENSETTANVDATAAEESKKED
ncbi:hypothetical protein [Actinobaculum suis]|uniref:hypothetical protein n=1 Tax=Actinobaculum suis TaxID=1657 RepID=UPI00210D6F28|nr:hypothetical protein [Actinobaculum suis]